MSRTIVAYIQNGHRRSLRYISIVDMRLHCGHQSIDGAGLNSQHQILTCHIHTEDDKVSAKCLSHARKVVSSANKKLSLNAPLRQTMDMASHAWYATPALPTCALMTATTEATAPALPANSLLSATVLSHLRSFSFGNAWGLNATLHFREKRLYIAELLWNCL